MRKTNEFKRRAAEEQRRKEQAEFRLEWKRAHERLHESELRLAESNGRLAQLHDQLAEDPEITEPLRALAWRQAGCVSARVKGDQLLGVPDGWPEGVDGENYVREYLEKRQERRAPTEPRPPTRGPLSQKLEDLLDEE